MKKLTEEEYNNLKMRGAGNRSRIFHMLFHMKVGEALLIEPEDWRHKGSPSRISRYIGKAYGREYRVNALLDGKGWAVKRVK